MYIKLEKLLNHDLMSPTAKHALINHHLKNTFAYRTSLTIESYEAKIIKDEQFYKMLNCYVKVNVIIENFD